MVTTNGGFLFLGEKIQELLFRLNNHYSSVPSGTQKSLYGAEIGTWDMEGMGRWKWQWSARINGNLKSHSGCPSALGIRLTRSVDRKQKASLLQGTSHPHTCKCSQGFPACTSDMGAFTGWVYQSRKHALV